MQSPEAYVGRPTVPGLTLVESATQTVTGTGSAVTLDGFRAILFELDVTSAPTTDAAIAVAANADDAQDDGTTLTANGTTLSVGKPVATAIDAIFRFTGLAIPNGATITSATLTLHRTANDVNSIPVTLDCINADNQAFPANHAAYAALTHTAGTADTISGGTTGTDYTSASFAADVQTVVNRASWASNNALVVCVRGAGASNGNSATFEAFDNVGTTPAVLTISYVATLDAFIQTRIDGTTWVDAVHFAQVLGGGGAKRFVSKLSASLALSEFETGTALAAGAVRNLFGSQYRARWSIVDAGNFAFSIRATGS